MNGSDRAVRLDIQALRAVAVALVVVFHLTPAALPGGFVGVDVFFVISGFLITNLLIERPPTSGRGLLEFWARRIRRLLPASLFVLAATLVATWALLPRTQWQATAEQARAAAIYVVNWTLISDAVDYLAAEQAPTAIQHFWSLAVEEQFYLGWPILILILSVLFHGGRRRVALALGISSAVVVSFAYSVHLTSTNPAVAYFSSGTRIWELGAGGLLALFAPMLVGRLGRLTSLVLAAAGWIAIVITGLSYSDATPFPGWQAALPVGGTLLVLAAHREFRWQELRPVHWLGDISYSVYLWHWPLIVFLPLLLARTAGSPERGAFDNVAIVTATLVLAGFTKTLVEDPFRARHQPASTRPRRLRVTYASSAVGMAIVVLAATGLNVHLERQQERDERALVAALAGNNPCLGAGALNRRLDCPPHRGPLTPTPALAAKDLPPSYELQANGKDCLARAAHFPVFPCHYGDLDSDFDVVIFGNSHAAHWVPALQEIGKARHWRVTSYLAASCGGYYALPNYPRLDIAQRCQQWGRDVVATLQRDKPELVILATHIGNPAWRTTLAASMPVFEEGFRKTLQDLDRLDRPVVVIRDTPQPIGHGVDSIPDCVAENLTDVTRCNGLRSAWTVPDPAFDAARKLDRDNITPADLSNYFCGRTACYAVIGGVIAYFDGHHISATYARTLAPYLNAVLDRALASNADRS